MPCPGPANTLFPAGTAMYKEFNNKGYRGTVQEFRPDLKVYLTQYDDGDRGEFYHNEVRDHLLPKHSHNMLKLSVDMVRLRRSRQQPFYALTAGQVSANAPMLYIIGSTGNEYSITTSNTQIKCSCPDQNPACKHILFLLSIMGAVFPTLRR